MNLDSPAGEAMIEAGAIRACDGNTDDMDEWVPFLRPILAAALAATVECAACGGRGTIPDPLAGYGGRIVTECPRCEGTGRRLAIKEMLDE